MTQFLGEFYFLVIAYLLKILFVHYLELFSLGLLKFGFPFVELLT